MTDFKKTNVLMHAQGCTNMYIHNWHIFYSALQNHLRLNLTKNKLKYYLNYYLHYLFSGTKQARNCSYS